MNRCVGLAAVACAFACGHSGGGGAPSPGPPAAPSGPLRIDPNVATVAVPIGQAATVSFRALSKDASGGETDVTSSATWSVDNSAVATVSGPGALGATGIGGHAAVTAALAGSSASAALTVTLTGRVFVDGADPARGDAFGGRVDPATPLVVEYPPNGVIVPANLPPPVVQWAGVGDAATFRTRLTSADVLDVAIHGTHRELDVPRDVWSKIAATAPDAPITLAVDGVGESSVVHTSAPQTLTITHERIEQTILFLHNCSHGGLDTLDLVSGKTGGIPTTEAWQQSSQIGHCPGCHTVARSGRRIGFTTLDGFLGTLGFDAATKDFAPALAPTSVHGSGAAFNPLESTTRAAMLTGFAIASQNVSGLALLDPDTGASLPSDLTQMLAEVPAEAGRGAAEPAWSNDGSFVVFSAFPNAGSEGVEPAQNISQGSLVEASVNYDGASFHFGTPKVLVQAAPGESNLRPSLDDADEVMAFMRTSVGDGGTLGATYLYRRADGQLIPVEAARPGGADARLPEWAPAGPAGSRYGWIVVASTRPYGHLAQTSQLWMFAVDRAGLAAGTADPSAPAFWLPGQRVDTSYTHAQWPRHAP